MTNFLKQRNLKDHNGNNIPQLESFGKSAWTFILAIFESGWDQLLSSNDITIRDNIAANFGKINYPIKAQKEYQNITSVKKILSSILL